MRTKLSWTHYRILSRIESVEKRAYYLNESLICNWNSRQLEKNIGSIFYERNLKVLKKEDEIEAAHFMKNPYILESAELAGIRLPNEKNIEDALVAHLQQFLMELFSFVARQQPSSLTPRICI